MTDNPYQAPRASLADQPEPERPKQIKIAVALMCASLIASMFYALFGIEFTPDEQEYSATIYFFSGITLLIIFIPIAFIWFRHNWARWTWLALTSIGWFLTLVSWDESMGAMDIALEAIFAGLDCAAAVLIFSGAGASWFKSARLNDR